VEICPLGIRDSFLIVPLVHNDDRGAFFESFQANQLQAVRGRPFRLAQMNTSESVAGTIRGIHANVSQEGQEKYVTCVEGAIIDVLVELDPSSRDFGTWVALDLNAGNRHSVFIPAHAGHAFIAVSERAKVVYLTSSVYRPEHEISIDALDPALGIPWPLDPPIRRSLKDQSAQGWSQFAESRSSAKALRNRGGCMVRGGD
jgi:dTDP-4-dehydrorhamnose 3,5-epimerase